jgi:KRAB domain-containing zinc finger protein
MDKWNMCPHCDYKSPWIQKWQAHIDAKHPEHGEQKYFCDHCPKSFIFEGSLRRHMEKVRAKVNKPKKRKLQLPCDYCEKVLKSYHLAKVHYRNHHPGRPIIASGHANYNCSNCANRFFTADDLEAHLNVEHGIDTKKNYCKDCKQPLKDQEHTCHFHFANKEKKKHVPFKCLICRKEFATKNTMKRHMEQIHEGKTYPCDQCTRTFTAPNSLKNHILIVHEKRFDYECQHCGKKWATKGLLQDHITQSHTSQVICNICNKQISNPIMLRRHKVFVHNEREGALFCELCPKSVFFSESTFEKHARDKH